MSDYDNGYDMAKEKADEHLKRVLRPIKEALGVESREIVFGDEDDYYFYLFKDAIKEALRLADNP